MQTNQSASIVSSAKGKKFNVLGHSITAILTKEYSGGNYYVFEVLTPPGLGIPPHVHEREDELIFVLEGEFEILLGDKRHIAKAGDEIFFPRQIPHAFQNIGTKAGKTLWTVIPGGNFEEFFEKLSQLPAGETDLILVVEIFAAYGMKVLVPEKI